MIGTTLAHYRITGELGAGGMGEVWRAEDEKLGREVALKVLPADVAEDPDRLARFEREAKVLASLNHPNIAHLYGLESVESDEMTVGEGLTPSRVESGTDADAGPQDPKSSRPQDLKTPRPQDLKTSRPQDPKTPGPVTFLVMELVEGEDLSDRISRGPIPIDETIPMALQIAEALEAAHEAGIVHRDLKPANIKLKPDGTVKVLDFGLAKAWESDRGDSSLSLSPTLTQHATAAGVILGTVAYMSPEQARGKKVDRRADIWSFGVVLWEMLTGHRLFDGETVSDVMAAVLTRDPDLDAIPDGTPRSVRNLLERCLTREPRSRLQWIGDARLELESPCEEPVVPLEAGAIETGPGAKRFPPWLIVAIAAIAAVGAWGWAMLSSSDSSPVIAGSVLAPKDHEFRFFYHFSGSVTVSPDGQWMTFSAAEGDEPPRLWLRSMGSIDARPIEGSENGSFPFWSPDSRHIAFFGDQKLKRVGIDGSPAITLCDATNGRSGSWSQDGTILFSPSPLEPLFGVSAGGGDSVPVTEFSEEFGESTHRWASFLPDGSHYLYLAASHSDGLDSNVHRIWLGELGSSERRLLVQARTNAVYASGHLLYVVEDILLAHPFDPDRLELTGDPIPVASGIGVDLPYYRADFAASSNGVLVYRRGSTSTKFHLFESDLDGNLTGPIGEPDRIFGIEIGPDGGRAALRISDMETGADDIWIHDLGRNIRSRLTFGKLDEWSPVWSPDGKHIAFVAGTKDLQSQILIVEVDGSGEPELLRVEEARIELVDWSKDGGWLVANSTIGSDQSETDVVAIPLDGGDPVPIVATRFGDYAYELSPDGRWLLYSTTASGANELFVTSFPKPGRKWQVAGGDIVVAEWKREDSIFYVTEGSVTNTVPVGISGDTVNIGSPVPHKGVNQAVMAGGLFPSGDRTLLSIVPELDENIPIIFMTNWTETIRQR